MTEYDAHGDGAKCFEAGRTIGMNPCEPGSYNWLAWRAGWIEAKQLKSLPQPTTEPLAKSP